MKNLNKKRNIAGQSNKSFPKSQKHDANLQKNSTLYFQIGLILCLLATYGIFEMEFKTKVHEVPKITMNDEDPVIKFKNYIVEPNVKPKRQVKKQSQKLIDKPPKVVTNDVEIVQNTIDLVKPKVTTVPISLDGLEDLKKPEDPIDDNIVNINAVEKVPIYPGCENEKNNRDRVKCMSHKMAKFIQRKFNTNLAADLGLSGLQKINVQFKIDSNGHITEIISKAPFGQLEDEAERVVNKMPKMTPGMQRDKPVSVMYYFPIVFEVR